VQGDLRTDPRKNGILLSGNTCGLGLNLGEPWRDRWNGVDNQRIARGF
jgi:hypothetical protein